jgi:DnaJ family protein C protein 9|eukprot:CAMPEP_0174373302 /NCGR_PEP_ID=MMETSP0811_2-20130205/106584_1 /TAXON_ID=73025 ORGANISM="Eutreptiella gymnastica-like, Strain CCMP1594" /NCGR_SAMPLE_ID=MMETSP0811_2 /ASSEMBLY_ACC=CAM_ASM_000667 /LENGTH=282 /DNA_ID=CAMNT_0015521481 /DNA_START=20 /DNA_END=868 /DNA_ORIENTATION=-
MEYIGANEDIYATIGVSKTATPQEIQRAYRQAALKYHPDRCEGDKEEATRMFQKLGFIHGILSDAEKRKVYDQTGDLGSASQELDEDALKMWKEYFDNLFPRVTEEQVESFAAKYKGSDDEKEDLINAYNKGKGSMDVILESVPLAQCAEESRYTVRVEELFKTKELERTALWDKTTTEKAAQKRRKAEAAQRAAFEAHEKADKKRKTQKSKDAGMDLDALQAAILQKRSSGFDDIMAKLERTYASSEAQPKTKKISKSAKTEEKKPSQAKKAVSKGKKGSK